MRMWDSVLYILCGFTRKSWKRKLPPSTSAISLGGKLNGGGTSILKLCVCIPSFMKPLFALMRCLLINWALVVVPKSSNSETKPLTGETTAWLYFPHYHFPDLQDWRKTHEDWEYGESITLEMVKFTDSFCSPPSSPEPSNERKQIRTLTWRVGVRRTMQWVEGNQKSSHEEEGRKLKNNGM